MNHKSVGMNQSNMNNLTPSLQEKKDGTRRKSITSLSLARRKSRRERRNSGIAEILPTPALPKDDDTESDKTESRRNSIAIIEEPRSRKNSLQNPIVDLAKLQMKNIR